MKRFDLCANTQEDALLYINNRALQIAHTGAILKQTYIVNEGIWAIFEFNDNIYHSLYLLNKYRGNGIFYRLWSDKCRELGYTIKMLTTTQCSLASYFRHKEIPFLLVNGLTNTNEYKLIENIYNDDITKRSGLYYMNHIDEGLFILTKINASLYAKLGYILHPAFQSDNELKKIYNNTSLRNIDSQSIINAIEYRNVANDYLSFRNINDINEIKLSPLKDVNDMLIADKIQNRKDFDLYHLGKHERSEQLLQYFKNWFNRLGISEENYQTIKQELEMLTTQKING